jgi:hypothetical protein
VTERIGLGTWVASPNFRHPVPFAKDVMGLDDISGGRFLLGVGGGGEGFDASVTGDPPTRAERTRRFEEFVGLLDQLLTHPVTSHQGKFYRADQARMIPGTIARPRTPFVVAANGPRAMALAARYGQGWATYGPAYATEDVPDDPSAAQEQWWTGLAGMLEQLDALEETARPADEPPLRRYLSLDGAPIFSMTSLALVTEGIERAAGLGFTDVVVHWPRAEGIYAGSESVLEGLVERLPELQAL